MDNPVTPLTPEQIAAQEKKTDHNSYLHSLLVEIDDTANVATGGLPDETISSRMARWDTEDTGVKHEVGKLVSEGLNLFQKDHGAIAEVADQERAKNVQQVEQTAQEKLGSD